MEAEERAIIIDLIHLEVPEQDPDRELEQEQQLALDPDFDSGLDPARRRDRHDRTEADSASRVAALVAPSPPDPDYFVG